MRSIGSDELKARLSKVLDAVERGQSVLVTRRGKPIARILPSLEPDQDRTHRAVQSLRNFKRTRLPAGVSIRKLIEEGRR